MTLNKKFKFQILSALDSSRASNGKNVGHLISDSWDDWFEFSTLFKLVVFDQNGERHSIGPVKFGEFGIERKKYYTAKESLPEEFRSLSDKYFSLGQDDTYFEALNELGDEYRDHILSALNEISIDDDLYERSVEEKVTRISLLRNVSKLNIKEQYRRLARGEARLTAYNFSYKLPKFRGSKLKPPTIDFNVTPNLQPPTNLHVIIGRNGVGKTHILRSMTRSLLDTPSALNGRFSIQDEDVKDAEDMFSNLVSVTFSAFDPFENIPERKDATEGIRYSYIGLQRRQAKDGKQRLPKSTEMLANEFVKSAQSCLSGGRRKKVV